MLRLVVAKKALSLAAVGALSTATAAAAATGNLPLQQRPEPVEVSADVAAPDSSDLEVIDPVADDSGVDTPAADESEPATDAVAPAEDESVDEPPVDDAVVDDSAVDEGPVDGDGIPYGDVACADAANHGEYVSGVAHDDRLDGQGKGSVVSQAAHTDCGKVDDDVDRAPGDDGSEIDDVDVDEDDNDVASAATAGHGKSNHESKPKNGKSNHDD